MEDWLKLLQEDDDLGLLDVKPKSSPISSDDRLINSFEEINTFIDENGREPELASDILEKSLYYRLEGIREDIKKTKSVINHDRHNLLNVEQKEAPTSLSDILDDDDLGLLSTSDNDIFNLRTELKEVSNRSVGTFDHVARPKKCEDFEKFETLFKACQADLKNKKRFLRKFKSETSIKEGTFFVYKGVLIYIEKVGKFSERNTRKQARLRCIYENGTESDILRNSLAKSMYTDGKIVSENINDLLKGFSSVNDEDISTGDIYILKSLSKDPNVKNIKDLYKIGYSEISVEDRIKNAVNEPTYLMAKVKVVADYKLYNQHAQKFEDILHKFFDSARVAIDVIDHNGTRCTPREWFQIPFEVIQEAIILLESGEIINYRYCRETRSIIPLYND